MSSIFHVVSVYNISESKKVFSTTLEVVELKEGNCQLNLKTQFTSNINFCLAGIRIQTERSPQCGAVTSEAPVSPPPRHQAPGRATSCPAQVTAASPVPGNSAQFYVSFIVGCKINWSTYADSQVCVYFKIHSSSFFWDAQINPVARSLHSDDWWLRLGNDQ